MLVGEKSSKSRCLRFIVIVNAVVICIFLFIYSSLDLFPLKDQPQIAVRQHVTTFKSNGKKSSKFENLKFEGFNGTHLWSMRIADDDHYELARQFPCRIVNYTVSGTRFYSMNTCDNSSNKDFSLENSIYAQKWLFEHQNPSDCSNKRFAIIKHYAWSGFGSVMHQVIWPFGQAIAENRIAIYHKPDDWIYTDCPLGNPDCSFLPITNCSLPLTIDGNRVVEVTGNSGHWDKPIHPAVFQNRSFNWYRSQLIFYLMRFNPTTLNHAINTVSKYFPAPSVDFFHPFISLYVRRSDKVHFKEMNRAFSLREYFDLFDAEARRLNISNIYINSEDAQVFQEFLVVNKEKKNHYKLLKIDVSRNIVFREMVNYPRARRAEIAREFLSDLFIQANADVHVGTLTSNWCRLGDEMRLVLGKFLPYYTPENVFYID